MQVTKDKAASEGQRPTVDSVERVLAQAGDAWTFLIVREAFFGVKRFDALLRNLSIPANHPDKPAEEAAGQRDIRQAPISRAAAPV